MSRLRLWLWHVVATTFFYRRNTRAASFLTDGWNDLDWQLLKVGRSMGKIGEKPGASRILERRRREGVAKTTILLASAGCRSACWTSAANSIVDYSCGAGGRCLKVPLV